jgi:cephalosporin-C deacetylase
VRPQRQDVPYRAVVLGCVRCIDYLVTRDDFKKKELAVTGGSQGGALHLITSGLDPRVTPAAPRRPPAPRSLAPARQPPPPAPIR